MARFRARITLAQLFALATLGVAVSVGILLYASLDASRRSILASAERLRGDTAEHIARQVRAELGQADRALGTIEAALSSGTISADDSAAVDAALFTQVVGAPHLTEATFTRAARTGFDADGGALLAPTPRWQASVQRSGHEIVRRQRADGDPTEHLTFRTTASQGVGGRKIWTDLHYAEADSALPEAERRIVVTVQKAVVDGAGKFLGVIRVGLVTDELNAIVRGDPSDAHEVFLFDDEGRLVTRLDPKDRIAEQGGDLRVVPAAPHPELARALTPSHDTRALEVDGRAYLTTTRPLEDTYWNLGIVVPEDHYTRDLEHERRRLLLVYLAVVLVLAVGGAWTVRALRGGLREIVGRTAKMRNFDFSAAPVASPFADVEAALGSLERAKTVTRALGKYVPVDLVRQLFEKNEEPKLGGALTRVSMMFTDIEGFTSLSERLAPDDLARALGQYLDAMTRGVVETGGTIDKFIGDAVMAIWNAPTACEEHAKKACEAALRCIEATRALYASAAWGGQPALFTRFGIHEDDVLVGHFGSPARLSYTALGDGVNLAARLEGLCKQYGVAILVSETVAEKVGDAFRLRRIDKVAVKGKSRAVMVYELVGRAEVPVASAHAAYERALDSYFARDFAGARATLANAKDDPPSAALAERCARLLAAPPPDCWDGVYVAKSK